MEHTKYFIVLLLISVGVVLLTRAFSFENSLIKNTIKKIKESDGQKKVLFIIELILQHFFLIALIFMFLLLVLLFFAATQDAFSIFTSELKL